MRATRTCLPAISAIALQAGCYRYVPMTGATPVAGERYEFEISDQGRVGLADRLGPGVMKVEGTLVRQAGDAYVVSIANVESLGNGLAHWSGEQVPMREDYVTGMQRREFSRGRTAVAIGSAAAAIGAFIVTRALVGSGSPPTSGSGGGPGQGS